VHDSSFSAMIAAEVGQLNLAGETALIDLNDLEQQSTTGSIWRFWRALIAGFGMRPPHGSLLAFAPRLPENISHLTFHLMFQDRRLLIDVTEQEVTYRLLQGSPGRIWHDGNEIELGAGQALTRPIPTIQAGLCTRMPSCPPNCQAQGWAGRGQNSSASGGQHGLPHRSPSIPPAGAP